jgi:hypothetical protein
MAGSSATSCNPPWLTKDQPKYSMAKSARHVYGLSIRKSQGLGKKKCDML